MAKFAPKGRTRLLRPIAALPRSSGPSLDEPLAPRHSGSGSFLLPSSFPAARWLRRAGLPPPDARASRQSRGPQGRGAGGRGPGRCSAAVCGTPSWRAVSAPGEPAMVRAGAVGTHLPASGLDIFGDLRKMNKRQLYYQVLNFAMIVSSALMIWKGLIVLTGSESPIVVVLSGSMEPAFHRGDLLFLTNFREDPIRAGEIVVFKVEGRDIPIVHRVIKVHEKDNGDIKFLTKGDNNEVDDRGLYKEGQNWLEKKDVVGRARGFLPYVGMVTIIMNDYPKFKYALLAVMGAYVLLKRES
ncbi:signal peptidase complex catalytic [Lynx pardinus]|nr:signal peptidase complex catalytic [Lynx pardinus]